MFEDIKLKLEDVVVKSSLKWYDFVILDTLPSESYLSISTLVYANEILVLVETHFLSLQRLKQLFEMVESIKRGLNTDLKILGLPPTRHTNRTNMNIETLKLLNSIYSGF
ncbi:MAG: ParA family protein [Endomicrobium sp.]|nr:ParA family protein [Endomicrobium sp.]